MVIIAVHLKEIFIYITTLLIVLVEHLIFMLLIAFLDIIITMVNLSLLAILLAILFIIMIIPLALLLQECKVYSKVVLMMHRVAGLLILMMTDLQIQQKILAFLLVVHSLERLALTIIIWINLAIIGHVWIIHPIIMHMLIMLIPIMA